MISTDLQTKILSRSALPALPSVAGEIMRALSDRDISADEISRLILRDQTMTMKVLAVANSSFYGFSRTISTIEMAVVILGINTIREIVTGVIAHSLLMGAKTRLLDINKFWRYSNFCGTAGRTLAKHFGYPLPSEAFVAGIIHDFGLFVVSETLPKEFEQIDELFKNGFGPLIECERQVIGNTHAELGGWLADRWSLPSTLALAISAHHTEQVHRGIINEKSPLAGFAQPLTVIIALAEWLAREQGYCDWLAREDTSPIAVPREFFVLIELPEFQTVRASLFAQRQMA